jgi:hypothetical protein
MSTENKYPGLPRELDRRRVLTEREIAEMRDLRNQGLSSRAIAANYAVSKTIVLYWTNDETYREKVNAKRYEAIAARCKRDPCYKKHRKELSRASLKSNIKRSEAIRKFKGKATYKWKKKKLKTNEDFRKKTNEQALNAYHRKQAKKAEILNVQPIEKPLCGVGEKNRN